MESFRRSMSAFHTWAGVVCSALLFAMFWMGTLSVFDREIDQWMMPHTRLAASAEPISLDQTVRPVLDRIGDRPEVYIYLPKPREPGLRIGYDDHGTWKVNHIDPVTGTELIGPKSLAGTGFIFPFHFSFHITWAGLGYWIAGFLAIGMLALLVSGVVIHRKLITEFFTFRPTKKARRATLDLHNMTSLVALPFHFMLPLTGLFIFFSIYLPWSIALPFGGDTEPLFAEMYGEVVAEPADRPAPMASLDAMLAETEARWQARPDMIRLQHWGDANARVTMRHVFPAREVTMDREALTFAGASGTVVSAFSALPVRTGHAWLSGLHFIQFDHWALRWLYFLAGLTGCAMIATGLLFWLRSREGKHRAEPAGFRVTEATTIAGVTGIVLATGVFLVTNRALPQAAEWLRQDRAALEVWAFWLTWLGTLLHAVFRRGAAWREQCWIIAVLAIAAVTLNAVTTGDHLIAAASRGLWAVAGLGLALLASAALAILAAVRLSRRVNEGDGKIAVSRQSPPARPKPAQ